MKNIYMRLACILSVSAVVATSVAMEQRMPAKGPVHGSVTSFKLGSRSSDPENSIKKTVFNDGSIQYEWIDGRSEPTVFKARLTFKKNADGTFTLKDDLLDVFFDKNIANKREDLNEFFMRSVVTDPSLLSEKNSKSEHKYLINLLDERNKIRENVTIDDNKIQAEDKIGLSIPLTDTSWGAWLGLTRAPSVSRVEYYYVRNYTTANNKRVFELYSVDDNGRIDSIIMFLTFMKNAKGVYVLDAANSFAYNFFGATGALIKKSLAGGIVIELFRKFFNNVAEHLNKEVASEAQVNYLASLEKMDFDLLARDLALK